MDSKCGINFKTGRCVNIAGKRRGVVVTGNDGANVCKLSKNDRCELTLKGREFSTRTLKEKARNNIDFTSVDETGVPNTDNVDGGMNISFGTRATPQPNNTDNTGNLVKGLGILSSFLRNQQRRRSKKRRRRSRKRKRSKSRRRKRSKSRRRKIRRNR